MKESMCVAAYYGIHISHSGCSLLVIFISQMAQAYHHITAFAVPEVISISVYHGSRILIFELGGDLLVDNAADIRKQTYHAYLHPGLTDNRIRLHKPLKRRAGKVIIGTDDIRLEILQTTCQLNRTIVEFMVSKTYYIKTQRIEHIDLDVSLQFCKI